MKPYCLAPFYHLHVHSDGQHKLCCIARNDLVEEKFQKDLRLSSVEFWNSDYLKDRREKMLKDSPPPECELCIYSNRNDAYKNLFDQRYLERSQQLSIKPPQPIDLDLRIPLCNLKCKICSPQYSTTLSQLYVNYSKFVEQAGLAVPVEDRSNREQTLNSFLDLIKSGSLENVYFAGGEPTLAPDHLKHLNLLVKHNPDVHICYNTNLSMKKEFLHDWVKTLKQFKNVSVQCSLDGIEKVGEYIRSGLLFEEFDHNLDYLRKNAGESIYVSLDLTLTSLGALDIVKFCEYALSKKLKVYCKFMVGGDATFLRTEYLSLKHRQKVIKRFNRFWRKLSDNEKDLLSEVKTLLRMLDTLPEFTESEREIALKRVALFKSMYVDSRSFEKWLLFLSKDYFSLSLKLLKSFGTVFTRAKNRD